VTRPLPQILRHLLGGAPQVGRVEAIGLRPARRAPIAVVDAWDLRDGSLDHARSATRAVTLIQAEHVPVIGALVGRPDLDFTVLRRNLLVSGISVAALRYGRIRIGEVLLEGTVPCPPCSRMEEALGAGGYAALVGMGGICAAVVQPGVIRVGDPVRLELPDP
jgi:MOSC domain-containing protein YiiM